MKIWTTIFVALQALNIIGTIAGFVIFLETGCEVSPSLCEDGELKSENYGYAAASLAAEIVSSTILLAAGAYGLMAIKQFDGDKLRRYFLFLAFFLCVQIVLSLISASGPNVSAIAQNIVLALIIAILGGYYVYAVKRLGERIRLGEITRQNPSGSEAHYQNEMGIAMPPSHSAQPCAQRQEPAVAYGTAIPTVVQGSQVVRGVPTVSSAPQLATPVPAYEQSAPPGRAP